MKTFQMNDKRFIFFENLNRIPAEDELQNVIDCLRDKYQMDEMTVFGLDKRIKCHSNKGDFNIIYTGEETYIFSENEDLISELTSVLNS